MSTIKLIILSLFVFLGGLTSTVQATDLMSTPKVATNNVMPPPGEVTITNPNTPYKIYFAGSRMPISAIASNFQSISSLSIYVNGDLITTTQGSAVIAMYTPQRLGMNEVYVEATYDDGSTASQSAIFRVVARLSRRGAVLENSISGGRQ